MTKKRQTYSEEFKLEAVQQWQDSGKSAAEVAKDLGISKSSLYKWKQELADELAQTSEARKADQAREADSETNRRRVIRFGRVDGSTRRESSGPRELREYVSHQFQRLVRRRLGRRHWRYL